MGEEYFFDDVADAETRFVFIVWSENRIIEEFDNEEEAYAFLEDYEVQAKHLELEVTREEK